MEELDFILDKLEDAYHDNCYDQKIRVLYGKALLKKGVALMEGGKSFNKIHYFLKKASEVIPEEKIVWVYMGTLYFKNNKEEKAEECFKKVLKIEPSSEEANLFLGQMEIKRENYVKAIEYLEKFTKSNDKVDRVWFFLSLAYSNQKNISKAISALEHAIELKSDGMYFKSLGILYFRNQNYEKAKNSFNKAIEKGVQDIDVYLSLANTHRQLKNYFDSLNLLKKVIDINPKNEEANLLQIITKLEAFRMYSEKSEQYLKEKKYQKAIACLENILKFEPESGPTWLRLYNLYFSRFKNKKKRELKTQVVKCIQKLKEIDPKNPKLSGVLVEFYQETEGKQATEFLIKELADENEEYRKTVIQSIKLIPFDFDVLRNALKDSNSNIKKSIIELLGQIRDNLSVMHLLQLINYENKEIKLAVLKALALIVDENVIVPLKNLIIKDSENIEVRAKALETLGFMKKKELADFFLELMKNKDSEIRRYAIWALGQIEEPRALKLALDGLKDQNAFVRHNSASTLGSLKNSEAIPALIKALQDENNEVRERAISALLRIGNSNVLSHLKEGLKDENPKVRVASARALGQFGDQSAKKVLLEGLKDEKNEVKRMCAWALSKLGFPQLVGDFIDNYFPSRKMRSRDCPPVIVKPDRNLTIFGVFHGCPECIKGIIQYISYKKPGILCVEFDIQRYLTIQNHFSEYENYHQIYIANKGQFENFPLEMSYRYALKQFKDTGYFSGQEMIDPMTLCQELNIPVYFVDVPIRDWIKIYANQGIYEPSSEENYIAMDWRNKFMCSRINTLQILYPKKDIYVIVGEGHIKGMINYLRHPNFVLTGLKHILQNPNEHLDIKFQETALRTAKEFMDTFSEINLHREIALSFFKKFNLANTLKHIIEAIALAKRINDQNQLILLYFLLSQILHILDSFEEIEQIPQDFSDFIYKDTKILFDVIKRQIESHSEITPEKVIKERLLNSKNFLKTVKILENLQLCRNFQLEGYHSLHESEELFHQHRYEDAEKAARNAITAFERAKNSLSDKHIYKKYFFKGLNYLFNLISGNIEDLLLGFVKDIKESLEKKEIFHKIDESINKALKKIL